MGPIRRSSLRREGIVAGVFLAIFLGVFGMAFLLRSVLSRFVLMLIVEAGFVVSAALFIVLRRA